MKILNSLYNKLIKINDTPQKIALGLGLGVFSGIFPGTGPIAALFLAFIFRTNRIAALLGALATNTWLSFVTFILAVKVGSAIFGVKWQAVYQKEIILPVIAGYLVVAFCLGLSTYLLSLLVIIWANKPKKFR